MTNPTPYYTTVGPADPNAGTRAKLYSGLALIVPALSFLATFGILSSDQVNALNGAITGIIGVLGAFGFGLAARKTNQQVHNGTFEEAPPNPVGTAFDQLDTIKQAVDQTIDHAQTRVGEAVAAIQGAAAILPGGAAASNAIFNGPVGDLIAMMAQREAPVPPRQVVE